MSVHKRKEVRGRTENREMRSSPKMFIDTCARRTNVSRIKPEIRPGATHHFAHHGQLERHVGTHQPQTFQCPFTVTGLTWPRKKKLTTRPQRVNAVCGDGDGTERRCQKSCNESGSYFRPQMELRSQERIRVSMGWRDGCGDHAAHAEPSTSFCNY